ncbi:MAG: hypothetical protein L0Y67_08780 [Gammaproteobacteria bacterium]|nr:hypothetical protein [Gammaproteobacteria bacterium]
MRGLGLLLVLGVDPGADASDIRQAKAQHEAGRYSLNVDTVIDARFI